MAIKYSDSTPTTGKYGSTAITQVKYGSGTYKFVDDVNITFVEGSSRTTVSYAIGATVNRSSAPSGAAFVGWSTSSSGASPAKTFTASKDMTVYRVVKYNDMTLFNAYLPKGESTSSSAGGSKYVDLSKYNNYVHVVNSGNQYCYVRLRMGSPDGSVIGTNEYGFSVGVERECGPIPQSGYVYWYARRTNQDIDASIYGAIAGKQSVG